MSTRNDGIEPRGVVLVVDDTPINQQILTEILGPEGYQLDFARDGETGLKKAHELKPDLVLLDLVLPGMMGTEVLDILKREMPETLVILTTAYGSEETAIKALRLGVNDYIINKRPFDADEVREVVKRAVNEAKLRQENLRLQRELQIKNARLEQAVRELTAAYERLKELDKAKASFFSMVSHDLRHPIAVAKGYLELILSDNAVTDQQTRGFVQVAEEEMLYINKLVDDVLDLSRMDAGSYHVECQPLSVTNILNQARRSFRTQTTRQDVVMEVQPAEGLPLVSADPLRINQVMSNLIENALKFTPEGTITLSARDTGDRIELTVQDTGVGVDPDELEKIFDRFYRVKRNEQPEDKGSGLGLAICREIVRLHGGKIWAESLSQGGAAFRFTLNKASDGTS